MSTTQIKDGSRDYLMTVNPDGSINMAGVVSGTFRQQGLTVAGRITTVSIDDSVWVMAPTAALANRNNIVVQNQSTNGNVILWNYSPTEPADKGFQIPQGGSRSVSITPDIPVYIRMKSGSGIACIEELA